MIQKLLLLCCLITASQGCNTEKDSVLPDPNPTPTFKTYSYLALGDSYTIGQSVAEEERYPNQLADSLLRFGIRLSPVKIIARTGWTTDELQAGIADTEDLPDHYDLVSLCIGVNNQYRGYPTDEYAVEFRELLEQAIELANDRPERVFVLSIPDYAYTPFGGNDMRIVEEIDAHNIINESITSEYNVRYFNVTPISRETITDPNLIASDGLHPSAKQYARWVHLMVPEVRGMLP